METNIKLSKREQEIGLCLIEGMSARNIAKKFRISLRTVEQYQYNIKKKLNGKNTYQTGCKLLLLRENF